MPANPRDASPPPRPLHPPLVHAPIGGVVVAAVCDLVSVIGGASHSWAHTWFKGGSYALIVATAAMFLAAVSGLIDRARQTDPGSRERAGASKHAAVMALMVTVCVVDLLLRTNRYDSAQDTPAVVLLLTLLAAGLAAVGGELGGRLVYRRGVGVQPQPAANAPPGDAPAMASQPESVARGQPGRIVREPMDNPVTGPPWRVRLATTLAAWVVAFALVMTLLSVFRDQLGSLPLALRAAVISGVLVTAMTSVVMPALTVAAERWLAPPTRKHPHGLQRPAADAEHHADRESAAVSLRRQRGLPKRGLS